MRIIEPSVLVKKFDSQKILRGIEEIGRTCYKSEDKITPNSSSAFVSMLVKQGHHAMIEHESISVKFIVDRGVTHEMVRHRIAAFAQESTRYCNYTLDKFDKGLTFIRPFFFKADSLEYMDWLQVCKEAESRYLHLVEWHVRTPQEARSVLPNSLKTEIWITANLREWRHILTLRCSSKAHPQIQQVMIPLRHFLAADLAEVFGNVPYNGSFDYKDYASVNWLGDE